VLDDTYIDVIIPAYNEQNGIAMVLADLANEPVRNLVVVDNGSTDRTAEVAASMGAVVVHQPERGYGAACLAGMTYLEGLEVSPDVVVFMDGDHADHAEQLRALVIPIVDGEVDFVLASRARGATEPGAITPQQVFGNWLATRLMRWLFRAEYTDLGPFRAIRYASLKRLGMTDRNYGWTIEMQIKAAKLGLKHKEIDALYRRRVGVSKVSGTLKGSFMAGYKILATLVRYA
jgi:glycosyltransferase involved in cell wall biosynthesis